MVATKKLLSPIEASVLAVLAQEGAGVLELPRLTQLTPTEVRQAVEDLQAHGLIEVSRQEEPHRAELRQGSIIRPTPQGQRWVRVWKRAGGLADAASAGDLDEAAIDERLSVALRGL